MGWAKQRRPRPLDLDTYPLSNLNRPRCAEWTKPGRCKPVLTMHIGFFACFSRHISRTQSFQQNRHIVFLALVALKLLVSLINRLVASSARIVVDRQTDRQTDTQNDYCNPRCACAPRVNYYARAHPVYYQSACSSCLRLYSSDPVCNTFRLL